ncbi:MAG: MmgE/PrpD family protein [Blastocatellia bacterium]|nr:MAG: MmgE/PrpD family protein [Blastocatellia bacterium]
MKHGHKRTQATDSPITLSRRRLLQSTGLIAVAAWSSDGTQAVAQPSGSIIATLTSYMAGAASRPLPGNVIEKTKHHVLDTLAAMISGSLLPPGRVAIQLARAHAGETVASVAGCDVVCGPLEAALANGMLAHSDETDDSHAPSHSHPGCAIVPAALAAGEQFHIDGSRFLRAVALGYDIGPRVTLALGGQPFQIRSHFSSHSIAGNFAAAAAAAAAAGLTERQMRWVLDYTAQQAAGIAAWQRDTDHIEKSLVFGGFPARNGVTAALIVQLGGTGVDDVFSGADNFLMAFAPQADSSSLVDRLGERYEVTQTNIKKWTVGSPIQAPLDGMEILRQKRPFEADQVRKVVVRVATSDAKTVNNREMPDICLQHMMAVMLLDKTASFDAAHDKSRMKDSAVLQERAKIELVPDEELERRIERREAVVEVTLTDGTQIREHVTAVRGTAQNPMTRDEVVAKCRDLMTPTIGAGKTKQLVETVLSLDTVQDIRSLRPLLQVRS